MFKKTILASSIVLAATAMAETQAPNTFTAGTTISAAEMNANFDAVEAGVNANTTATTNNSTEIDSINTALGTLNSTVSSLETAVANLQADVDGLSSGGSVDLQSYVGSGVYQVFFRDQQTAEWGTEFCAGSVTLIFNSGGVVQDGVLDDNGTPLDESDDVLTSGSGGESLCVETSNGGATGSGREVWADVGTTWSLTGQVLTLTFIEQLENANGHMLYEDGTGAELYEMWGASNNANPSQFYENIWTDYIDLNGYQAQWTDNGDGTGTIDIWYPSSTMGVDPADETWTDGAHYFYTAGDTIYTGDTTALVEKEGPVSEDFTITADGNIIIKQTRDLYSGNELESELIIGVRTGDNL